MREAPFSAGGRNRQPPRRPGRAIDTARPRNSRASALVSKALLADGAVLATVGAIVGLFLISAGFLEAHGIAYTSPGGGFTAKFHPPTFLAMLALALRCLATHRPLRTAWRLITEDAGLVMMFAAAAIADAFAIVIFKVPFTALIDTFLLPALCTILMRSLDAVVLRRTKAILVAGLAAFSSSVILLTGRGATTVLLFYFILVSGAASLSGKTTTFALVTVVVLVFLRKDERTVPLRTALRLRAA